MSNINDFEIENGILSKYTGAGGDVVIPNNVSSIGSYAFYGCENLTSITIPDSVTIIGDEVFRYCTSLKSITIPATVTRVGYWAFYGCKSLLCIAAPHFSLEGYDANFKRKLAVGFAVALEQGRAISEERRIEYMKYIKGQRKKLYAVAVKVPALLRLMMAEKYLPDSDYENVRKLAETENNIELTTELLDYQQKNLRLVDIEKQLETEMKFATTGILPVADAKKIWQYEKKEDGTLLIKGYKGTEIDVVIPVQIGKYNVTGIGEYAFSPKQSGALNAAKETREKITSVAIPDCVMDIGTHAFAGCIKLTGIEIPNKVKSIGDFAFSDCMSLTSITIPNSVMRIDKNTFYNCTNLRYILAPHLSTAVYNPDFKRKLAIGFAVAMEQGLTVSEERRTEYMKYIKVHRKNLYADAIKEPALLRLMLTEKYLPDSEYEDVSKLAEVENNNALLAALLEYQQKNLQNIKIPDGETSIGDRAFCDCPSLKSIIIPDSVTSIGYGAFSLCMNLTSITIPNSVTSIGYGAFWGCESLTSITIPGSVKNISRNVFNGCINLQNITIPSSVISIEERAFWGCKSLTRIMIPCSVTSICDEAFWACENMKIITIPDSVTKIGDYVFGDCHNLTIHTPKGSAAEKYAKLHKIPVVTE